MTSHIDVESAKTEAITKITDFYRIDNIKLCGNYSIGALGDSVPINMSEILIMFEHRDLRYQESF